MEINLLIPFLVLVSTFKIDFIVWKLKFFLIICDCFIKFKIDFIVWKSSYLFYIGFAIHWFKIDFIVYL